MIKTSVALIGFMATGKTTVGNFLAKRLGENYQHIEMDQMIENLAGKSIPEIFSQDGEKYFRKLEVLICKKIAKMDNCVISCGGGAVLNKRNIKNLHKKAIIIHLRSSLEAIYERILINGIKTRPVINKENFEEEIKRIYKIRSPLYQKIADVEVETSDKDVDTIVDEIIERLKKIQKS